MLLWEWHWWQQLQPRLTWFLSKVSPWHTAKQECCSRDGTTWKILSRRLYSKEIDNKTWEIVTVVFFLSFFWVCFKSNHNISFLCSSLHIKANESTRCYSVSQTKIKQQLDSPQAIMSLHCRVDWVLTGLAQKCPAHQVPDPEKCHQDPGRPQLQVLKYGKAVTPGKVPYCTYFGRIILYIYSSVCSLHFSSDALLGIPHV